jgi:uncharacterized protein (TIGR02452 family)
MCATIQVPISGKPEIGGDLSPLLAGEGRRALSIRRACIDNGNPGQTVMRLNRNQRAQMAQETIQIIGQGHYLSPAGRHVDIGAAVTASVSGTREFPPDEAVMLPHGLAGRYATQIRVQNETTLAAARRLTADHRTIALNFASAKNPGGGFLSGSEAQEESLARSSGLYACLEGRSMYAFHRGYHDTLYMDYVIYSPSVAVFRDDDGKLLETPFTCSFLTAPAPNAGAVLQLDPARGDDIRRALRTRINKVLAVAAVQRYDAIVLGAWGCGVFKNDPRDVAEAFQTALSGDFAGIFRSICFAVLDHSNDRSVIAPFERAFGSSSD